MRFGIVVSDPDDWTARAMMASFIRRGSEAFFLNFSELTASLNQWFSLSSNEIDMLSLDGLVVRDLGSSGASDVGASDVAFRFETIRALGALGLPVVNTPESIARAANKFATSMALKKMGVPTPRTTITNSLKEALKAVSTYEKAVSKPLFGYKGKEIVLLTEGSEAELKSIMERQGMVYLQEFVFLESPRDIRAFVVDDRVLGAIYRVAQNGQWISNLARGGRAYPCPITEELRDLAVRASRAAGTVYAGIDLLETSEGLKVIEVNGTPSGKGIYEALGVDVTKAIADYVIGLQASK